MNRNFDSLPGRTEALIPLVRKRLAMNSRSTATRTVPMTSARGSASGRLMEQNELWFL